jgi:hypothetical protein
MDLLAKWRRWLAELKEQTVQLLTSREVYIEVRNIVAANPSIRTDNRLIGWMTWNYVQSMLISVRRLVDARTDIISLERLLGDMEKHCDLLTRESHIQLYSDSDEDMEWQANSTFESLAGKGSTTYPKENIQRDRSRLVELWKRLKPLANKRIAHLDERGYECTMPKYDDLDRVIDEIERQIRRYCLLLEATDYATLQPVPQYDWKAIFRVPWLATPPKRLKGAEKSG